MPDTPKEAEVRAIVRGALEEGIFPSPKLLNQEISGIHGQNGVNGMAARIRREELERAGYTKHYRTGRWRRG